MCGRYNFTAEEAEEIKSIIREVSEKLYGQSIKTGEIYPTDLVPVLVAEQGNEVPVAMSWGFPHFKGSGVIINAKSETVKDKRMFQQSVLTRRCIIPSTGFYEWGADDSQLSLFEGHKSKGSKVKYQFTLPHEKVLYMAGFYDRFHEQDGTEKDRFVILTTNANSTISDIHDRMPVVLWPDERSLWLSSDVDFNKIFDRSGIDLERRPA